MRWMKKRARARQASLWAAAGTKAKAKDASVGDCMWWDERKEYHWEQTTGYNWRKSPLGADDGLQLKGGVSLGTDEGFRIEDGDSLIKLNRQQQGKYCKMKTFQSKSFTDSTTSTWHSSLQTSTSIAFCCHRIQKRKEKRNQIIQIKSTCIFSLYLCFSMTFDNIYHSRLCISPSHTRTVL